MALCFQAKRLKASGVFLKNLQQPKGNSNKQKHNVH